MRPIVVVGSMNMDLVTTVAAMPRAGETVTGSGFAMHPGGKGANQAVAAARLGQQVRMIAMVGDDEFGRVLRSGLQREGIDVSSVGVFEGSSGVASILVNMKGENSIVVTPGANQHVTPEYLATQSGALRDAGMVLAQLETPLECVMWLARLCVEVNIPLMLDPAPAQPLPAELFSLVNWFTPNDTEAAFYVADAHRDAAAELLAMGCRGVVLKQGERGALVVTRESTRQVRPYVVHAVDTTAAGDCFNGAFAAGLNNGLSAVEAADFAALAAALSVTRKGAQPSMPTKDEVAVFRKQHSRL